MFIDCPLVLFISVVHELFVTVVDYVVIERIPLVENQLLIDNTSLFDNSL